MKFRFVLLPDDDPDAWRRLAQTAAGGGDPGEEIYFERPGGIYRRAANSPIPVANFRARITRDILLDDGEGGERCSGSKPKWRATRPT